MVIKASLQENIAGHETTKFLANISSHDRVLWGCKSAQLQKMHQVIKFAITYRGTS